MQKESLGKLKHTWNPMILNQSASFFPPFHDKDAFLVLKTDCGQTGKFHVETWWSSYEIRWHVCCRPEETHRGRRRGEACMAPLMLLTSQSDDLSVASVIHRKGSHENKKPFRLQPLELQCRRHICKYTQKDTHMNKYTRAWSESKGWFQRQSGCKIKRDCRHLLFGC